MNTTQQACRPQNNTSVHASAGSGKTFLLISRLLRLLLSGVQPDAVLAITFTRKAAAEMQQRLLERLRNISTMQDTQLKAALDEIGMPTDTQTCQLASNLYEKLLKQPRQVNITTFHAFSQQILRRFSLEADIPAGFELLDKTGVLEIEAWDALFADATKNPDSILAKSLETLFRHCNGLPSTKNALQSFLMHRSDWWALAQGNEDIISSASNILQTQLEINPKESPDVNAWFWHWHKDISELAELIGMHDTATNKKHKASILRILSEQDFTIESLLTIKAMIVNKGNGLPKKLDSKTVIKSLGDANVERLLTIQNTLGPTCSDFQDLLARHKSYEINIAWYQAGQAYLDHFQTIKQQQRLLDFTDLEWQACQLLNTSHHANWIQYKLDQRIDHLLVDEFQDTNPTQWRLLLPLLEELAAGEAERQRSVFLVGDAKQSIYRFRRADSQLFSYARDWLSKRLDASTTPLNTSWRSAPAIIDFVNLIFTDTPLGKQIGDFDVHSTHQQSVYGEVHVLPLINLDVPEQTEENTDEIILRNPLLESRQEKPNARDEEASIIANKIHELVESNTVIDDNGVMRPAHYGDIMILLRNRTHLSRYELALQKQGIPYNGSAPGTLLSSIEIQDMQALLDTLNTPYNNLALARVLRSPLFSCTEQDLMALSRFGRGKKINWFTRLKELDIQGSPSLARAQSLLQSWHKLANTLPVHDLLDHIYSSGDVMARFKQSFPSHLHNRVLANLRRFIELALEIDSGRYPSLALFRARLSALHKQGKDGPNPALDTSIESKVNIMTIHGAKGLEAPIVFLVDSASVPENKQAYKAVIDWPSGELQPRLFQLIGKKENLDSKTIEVIEQQQVLQKREDANLLYVAVTRARQYLYISASKPGRQKEAGWYEQIHQQLEALNLLDTDNGYMNSSNTAAAVTTKPLTSEAVKETHLPDYLFHKHIDDQSDTTISPSQSEQENENQQSQLRGTVIHEIIEKLLNNTPRDILNSQIQNKYLAVLGNESLDTCWQEASNVVNSELHSALFNKDYFEKAWNEVSISYTNHEGKTIHGIIDRLVQYKNELLIIDYKTHQHADEQSLLNEYKKQLQYYAAGVQKLWPGMNIKACLLLTASNEIINIDV